MNKEIKKTITDIIETHKQMVEQLCNEDVDKIAEIADVTTSLLQNGGTVYICGNGGSAADAQHIAGELVGRFRKERKALAAIALSTDTSILTSVANDYSYEKIFSRQIEAFVKRGDILWAFSTSGNSPNIIDAAVTAKEHGAKIIAFTGRKGSKLEQISDICFCSESESTARSQEIHQLAYHIICDIIESNFADKGTKK